MQEQCTENWREIPETNGLYEVSDLGRIRSVATQTSTVGRQRGRILSLAKGTKGYLIFRLCLGGGCNRMAKVHRMVALAFIGPCPEGMQVNHKDGNKENNRPGNLEYVTCKENVRHSWANGLHKNDDRKGESQRSSKLTDAIVTEVRRRYPGESLEELATKFGVTRQCLWMVVKRKTWNHV